jgi:outer membrane lipoprotein-sorting protein
MHNLFGRFRWFATIPVLLLACSVSARQGDRAWTADAVLSMMDKAAHDFHSLSADLEHIKYTDVVKDTSTETGRLFVRHDSKMRVEIGKPDARTILRTGDSLFIFNPKINRVEEYDLGKHRSMVDQYLLLGFGTHADAIRKNYEVSAEGQQTLDGRATVVLNLVPKAEQIRSQIAKIQMWIDESSWMPVQQKFYEAGSSDYILFHYTNLVKNLKISDTKFKQDWPKNVTRVKPRG